MMYPKMPQHTANRYDRNDDSRMRNSLAVVMILHSYLSSRFQQMFGCFLFHVSGQLGRGISVDGGVVVGGGGGVGGPTYYGICLFIFWLR
jgi:hypothetical protein